MTKIMIAIVLLTGSIIAIVLVANLMTAPTHADPYSRLTGDFAIIGEDAIDPPPGQKQDRLGIFLDGDSAKRTYEAMKVKPTNDQVCEEGMLEKRAGGLVCDRYADGTYSCSVAIMLTTGETRSVDGC